MTESNSFRFVNRVCGLATAAIGATALLGWLTGVGRLTSIDPAFIPMAPNTALVFVLLGLVLFLSAGAAARRAASGITAIAAPLVVVLSLLTLAESFGLLRLGVNELILAIHGWHAGVPRGVMSPVTAGTFVLQATALFVLLRTRSRRAADLAAVLATASASVGAAVVLGYLYRTPLFAGGRVIPVALNTGLAFVLSSVGLVAAAGADAWPVRSFRGPSVRAILLRTFLPLTLTILVLGGLLSAWAIGLAARNPALVTAVVACGAAVVVAVVVARVAVGIGTRIESVESALRASEAKYRTLFDQSSDGILIADVETKVFRYANPAASRMLGYSESELRTMGVADIHPRESLPRVLAEFATVARGERTTASDIPCLRKDGSIVYTDVNAAVVAIDGRVSNAAFLRDITERKHAQAERERLEEQVRVSQKMEAVGQLAGGVAHDFNNLMSIVLSYSSFLLEDLPADSPARADVEEIQKAGERSRDLTQHLLAFSRKQVLEPKIVQLDEIVAGMSAMLRRVIREDIEFCIRREGASARTKVDPGQIEQVILNLVVNARDAMPAGGKLTIETAEVEFDARYSEAHPGSQPGTHVMLAVSDTGIGMDRAIQERIFEPFFTTKERGKGTGLGLATVYGIVKQSGGSIWVYSEVGKGTTFKIYFPCNDEKPATHALHPAASADLGGKETVLVVEDEEAVRTIVCTALRRNGYTVLEAASPADALALSDSAGHIDLLLTDVVMPGMGGREVAARIAARRPGICVLFMSGYTDDAMSHHGVLDPGVALLQKPVTPDALARKVREVLDAPPQELMTAAGPSGE